MAASAPAEALQKAIAATILGDTGVQALFDVVPRVFDEVPTQPRFPYIVVGDDQLLDDSHCDAAWEANCTIHVFARPGDTKGAAKGKVQAKQIGDALIAALNVELEITGFVCVHADDDPPFQSVSYFYEPDRLTAHGVLVFKYLIDQAVSD